ncbi:MAG: hypothetical protein SPE55_03100 [Sodaliphilus sp.]|nr:hypothetical protein [Sodaliphilus sp.]
MKKMYFTSKKSFLVEQNAGGTLLITKTSTMKPLENAGSFIVSQGGIEAILAKCVEVTEEQFAEDRKQLLLRHEQARQHSLGVAIAKRKRHEEEYNAVFNGGGVVETTVENIRTLLRYLNDINWGVWQLPSMTIGYSCNQYDCDGKTATTIRLNSPIEYRGEQVSQFQYGAPSGHLRGYHKL